MNRKPQSLPIQFKPQDLGDFGFGIAASNQEQPDLFNSSINIPRSTPLRFESAPVILQSSNSVRVINTENPIFSLQDQESIPIFRCASSNDCYLDLPIPFPEFSVTLNSDEILQEVSDQYGEQVLELPIWNCGCLILEYLISDHLELLTSRTYQSSKGYFTLMDVLDLITNFYEKPFTREEAEEILHRIPHHRELSIETAFERTFQASSRSEARGSFQAFVNGYLPRWSGVENQVVIDLSPSEHGSVRLEYSS